jgi:purine-binding chemotaxis protein CheW
VCALPLVHTAEIMRPLPIQALESAPHGVLGAAVVRGEPIPVVSAAALLDAEGESVAGRFVALRVGERRVALAVDAVIGVRTISTEVLGTVPPLLARSGRAVASLGTLDASLLVVLDAARLIPDEEGLTSEPPSAV